MNPFIIITTIFKPTEAILHYADLENYRLIIVGDKKTANDWVCDGAKYLSVQQQKKIGNHLNRQLPYNHYCRKMMGYLHAIMNGADQIIDLDDDIFPKKNWGFPALKGQFPFISPGKGFINIYQYYSDKNIWPRGLPLDSIAQKFDFQGNMTGQSCKIGVWQALSDGDPDVDAIYRLTNNDGCNFFNKGPIVLGKNTVSPYNSQNTLTRKELFPLLYLPAYTSFRFTDILRSLVAQPIMWLYDYHLGFTDATTIQKRNAHNYYEDFVAEIPMYRYAPLVVEIVSGVISGHETIGNNLHNAYEALQKNKIILSKELKVLEAWLKELSFF
ncbi:MAG TPA: STELLO glycosyltransferase family protein [Puia sp.]|nr:STELLO glycosyltransferase family protein [Puia sp.]